MPKADLRMRQAGGRVLPAGGQDLQQLLQELPQQSVQGLNSLLLAWSGSKPDGNHLNRGGFAVPAARRGTARPCCTKKTSGTFPRSQCTGKARSPQSNKS